jgi:hypothetical protein
MACSLIDRQLIPSDLTFALPSVASPATGVASLRDFGGFTGALASPFCPLSIRADSAVRLSSTSMSGKRARNLAVREPLTLPL